VKLKTDNPLRRVRDRGREHGGTTVATPDERHQTPRNESAQPMIDLRAILVPVDGTPASLEAVKVACGIGRKIKARIYVVHVIEVQRALPLDAELQSESRLGGDILRRAEQIAEEMDCEIEAEILQAREAHHAIVDEGSERGVDAIIMGVTYKREFGEFTLGKTANYVLKHAPCQVWLCRGAIRE
jgi:nucleotide-binding universal stress UspA family protein